MNVLLQVVRVALLLVLAAVAVSLVVAIARPETGGGEKLTLAALVVACIAAGAAVTTLTKRVRARFMARSADSHR